MRALLAVNVPLALFDDGHVFHAAARQWLTSDIQAGWASCPTTQTGFVRVISGAAYPAPLTTPEAVTKLALATSGTQHEFWADDVALVGPRIDRTRLLGHHQVTDACLLALAVAHGGRLVTLDRRVTLEAVPGATPDNLLVL